jgi:hypothetical protein
LKKSEGEKMTEEKYLMKIPTTGYSVPMGSRLQDERAELVILERIARESGNVEVQTSKKVGKEYDVK